MYDNVFNIFIFSSMCAHTISPALFTQSVSQTFNQVQKIERSLSSAEQLRRGLYRETPLTFHLLSIHLPLPVCSAAVITTVMDIYNGSTHSFEVTLAK